MSDETPMAASQCRWWKGPKAVGQTAPKADGGTLSHFACGAGGDETRTSPAAEWSIAR